MKSAPDRPRMDEVDDHMVFDHVADDSLGGGKWIKNIKVDSSIAGRFADLIIDTQGKKQSSPSLCNPLLASLT